MNIEIISGSPRTESITKRIALFLDKEFKNKCDHNIGLIDLSNWNLGLLQEVFKTVDTTPDKFKPLAERIFAADAFVLVTPEYNGSYSPALKNLFDHFPKQSRKVFGIVTASTGALGGARSSQQMLLFVPALFGITSPYLLITPHVDKKFDENGNLLDLAFQSAISTFKQEFLYLAESVHKTKN
ncbi:MAG TPA: NAD(P)H-dependent oxidoreductase [Chitinophagaceae bacterium]|nr:NAD(P)H-dependent oxidoreductase [Chitinophagaceae bacterium]MCC6635982.1 NAD(P)H-dependent oxidoreductase [Chitinophagaceae bacterium]HMZ46991.1 NAD(P)H-dependent oxidoreductase [Chitinophagaceae bacterium]HNE92548.1 NAD(P)H-dependent oxidoreductase [Chitinophagaceae bacterium]HNF30240.1 NAD(P)H-dependent oxidoreductase [Chitinophagaceae bacterium]